MLLGLVGERPGPSCVNALRPRPVPAVEVFDPERLEVVHVLMGFDYGPRVTGLAEQDAAPLVDELGDVKFPIDLRYLTEDRFEQFIEHNLPVEADDQVVDIRPRFEIVVLTHRWFGGSHRISGSTPTEWALRILLIGYEPADRLGHARGQRELQGA